MITVNVKPTLVNGMLDVDIVASATMAPTYSPQPSTATYTPTPDRCGSANDPVKGCCDVVQVSFGGAIRDFVRDSDDGKCCDDYCHYRFDGFGTPYYLVYASAFGRYYILNTAECFTGSSLSYYAVLEVSELQAACVWSTPSPTNSGADPSAIPTTVPSATPSPKPSAAPIPNPSATPSPKPSVASAASPQPTGRDPTDDDTFVFPMPKRYYEISDFFEGLGS
jgi:hypothetical protein